MKMEMKMKIQCTATDTEMGFGLGFTCASCVAFSTRLSIYINKQPCRPAAVSQWEGVAVVEAEGRLAGACHVLDAICVDYNAYTNCGRA